MKRTFLRLFSVSVLFVSLSLFACKVSVNTPTNPDTPETEETTSKDEENEKDPETDSDKDTSEDTEQAPDKEEPSEPEQEPEKEPDSPTEPEKKPETPSEPESPSETEKEPEPLPEPEPEVRVPVSFSLVTPFDESSAVPVFEWNDFTFDIRTTTDESDSSLLRNLDYETLLSASPDLIPGTYKFIMSASKNNDVIFKGISETIILEKDEKNIVFTMLPEKGLKGSASITLNFPSDVKKIEASWSSDISGSHSSNIKIFSSSVFTETENTNKKICYFLEDLDSGLSQYAVFKFFNYMDTQIGSYSQSLIIAGGLQSSAEIILNKNSLDSHPVSLSFSDETGSLPFAGKNIVLKNKNETAYPLDLDGEGLHFTACIPEGNYQVFIDDTNTNLFFDTKEKSIDYIFRKITVPSDNKMKITVTEPITGAVRGSNENSFYIPENSAGLEFTVTPERGYKISPSGLTINDKSVQDTNPDKNGFQILLGSESENIITGGLEAVAYSISFTNTDDVIWEEGYTVPDSYNIETAKDIVLPAFENLFRNGFIFDGWTNAAGQKTTTIPAENTGDVSFSANWKEGAYIDSDNRTVYAGGKSLIVKESGFSTEIWYDFNRNSLLDADETPVMRNKDFFGYSIKGFNPGGSVPETSLSFTITGGNILSVEGLGSSAVTNLFISGNTTIGNDDSGIILSSFIDPKFITVNGPLSSESRISIISENEYTAGTIHYLVYLDDENFATLENFKAIYRSDIKTEEIPTAFKNSNNKKALYLSSPTGIGMPEDESGLSWIDDGDGGNSKTKFTLGESFAITKNSPIFSIRVTNGFFTLKNTYLKDSNGIQISTENLAELLNKDGDKKYHIDSELNSETEYTYLHMLSKDNKITPEAVTEFIQSIIFNKESKDSKIEVSINIETMPFSEIEAKYNETGDNFKYYDGSFYLRVDSGYIDWHNAYNNAKATKFNGLDGYLMTITSELENNYIFEQLKAERAWMGGTRLKPDDGDEFDASEMNVSNGANSAFYWACGPEAGQMIYNGVRRTTADILTDGQAVSGVYTNFMNAGFRYYNDTDKTYKNISAHEPNNGDLNSGAKETCLQFFKEAGWNDMPEKIVGVYDNPESPTNAGKDWGFSPKSYVVEFRPYETQTADNEPVTMTGQY